MPWLSDWQAFVKTVEFGSMAAAARILHCSRAQVSKQLAELERQLGIRLLERSTRRLHLTPGGEVFYQRARRILDEIGATELALQGVAGLPSGILRLIVPASFGRLHVAPLLPALAERYPDIHCELTLSDRLVDIGEKGFDLALRLTDAPPPELVARKLADIRRVICASPDYLQRRGTLATPEDLRRHDCFATSHARTTSDWRLAGPQGEETIPIRGRFQINHVEAIRDAVLAGYGLAILPTYLVAAELATGQLLSVLDDFEPLTIFGRHIYACYPPSRVQLPRLQVFLAVLEAHFNPTPPWERSKIEA